MYVGKPCGKTGNLLGANWCWEGNYASDIHMLHGAGIFTYKTGSFMGQMLVNIPYMEHMGYVQIHCPDMSWYVLIWLEFTMLTHRPGCFTRAGSEINQLMNTYDGYQPLSNYDIYEPFTATVFPGFSYRRGGVGSCSNVHMHLHTVLTSKSCC